MKIKKASILITLFVSGVFLSGCSQSSIKRPVYFNFSLGASKTETSKQWGIFKNNNNGYFFTKHDAADNITYYSSIDVRSNKYDSEAFPQGRLHIGPHFFPGQLFLEQSNFLFCIRNGNLFLF